MHAGMLDKKGRQVKDGQIRSDKAQGQRRYILSLHLDVFTSRGTFAKDLNMFDFS